MPVGNRRRRVVIVLTVVFANAVVWGDGVNFQIDALADHIHRHPIAGAADVYKFLHQSEYGPGHMISDDDAPRRYLERELSLVDSRKSQGMMCESLAGDPSMVRVHLGPFVQAGHDPESLLNAFVESANRIEGNASAMARSLAAAVGWLETNDRQKLAVELDQLKSRLEDRGYPAVHHSDPFRAAYDPHYRVILEDLAKANGWCP